MELVHIALNEYGVRSIVGGENNPRVLNYFHDIGQRWVDNDDTAWCAAFVNWCLQELGLTGTGSLAARSFLDYGEAAEVPQLGDIVVLWRIQRVSPFGHVAIFITSDEENVYLLGGNQDNSVKIKAFPKAQVLGYRHVVGIN